MSEPLFVNDPQELMAVLDHAPLDVWWIDEQHRIVKINQTARSNAQRAQVDILGSFHHEVDPSFLPVNLERLFSGEEKRLAYERQCRIADGGVEVREEVLLVRETDSGRMVVRYGKNLLNAEGDFGDQRKKQHHLEGPLSGAETTGSMRNEFIANMNHEIRTPMNAIIGYAEMLLEGDLNARDKRFAQAIFKSGMSLVSILNDIIDLSKLEAGRLKLSTSAVNLQEIVNELDEIVTEQIGGKQLSFTTCIDEKLPPVVFIDGIRLKQVLQNLLSNAIKFTPHGRVELLISGENRLQDRNTVDLIVAVKDSGIGIPRQDHPIILKILNPDFKGLQCSYKGRGFGLALCGRLVAMMGGAVSLESAEGEGSTFTLNFPAIEVSPQLDRFEHSHPPLEKQEVVDGCLLIVDDMDLIQEVLKDYFLTSPIEVLTAGNGEEAVRLAAEKQPDIIFMDLHLVGKDGRAVTRELRENSETGNIPVIVMTGDMLEEADYVPLFDGFLQKPFRFDELEKIVRRYCRKEASAQDTPMTARPLLSTGSQEIDHGYARLSALWDGALEKLLQQAVYSGSLSRAVELGVMIREQGEAAGEQTVINLGKELIRCATEHNIFGVEQLLRHLERNDQQEN